MKKNINKILNDAKKINTNSDLIDLSQIKSQFNFADPDAIVTPKSPSSKLNYSLAIGLGIAASLALYFINDGSKAIESSAFKPVNNSIVSKNENSIAPSNNTIHNISDPNKIEGGSKIVIEKKTNSTDNELAPLKSYTDEKNTRLLNVREMSSLELSPGELQQLGIIIQSGRISFIIEELVNLNKTEAKSKQQYEDLGYDTNQNQILVKHNCTYSTTMQSNLVNFDGSSPEQCSRLMPLLIEYVAAGKREQIYTHSPLLNYSCDAALTEYYELSANKPTECELIDKYGTTGAAKVRKNGLANEVYTKKLVPIKIELGKYGGDEASICVMWFAATQDFIDALPIKVATGLSKEINMVAMVDNNSINKTDACKGLKDKSIFEICRAQSGAIESAMAYPNPCENFTKLTIKTSSTRKEISVTLHDFTGKLIKELKKLQSPGIGLNSIDLDLSDVNAGSYLIAVHTELGEQAVVKMFRK